MLTVFALTMCTILPAQILDFSIFAITQQRNDVFNSDLINNIFITIQLWLLNFNMMD